MIPGKFSDIGNGKKLLTDDFFYDPNIMTKFKAVKKLSCCKSVEVEGKLLGTQLSLATLTLKAKLSQIDFKKVCIDHTRKFTLDFDIPITQYLSLTARTESSLANQMKLNKGRIGVMYENKNVEIEADANTVDHKITISGIYKTNKLCIGGESTILNSNIIFTPAFVLFYDKYQLHTKLIDNLKKLECGLLYTHNTHYSTYFNIESLLNNNTSINNVDASVVFKRSTSKDLLKLMINNSYHVGIYYEYLFDINWKIHLSALLKYNNKSSVSSLYGIGTTINI